MVSASAFLRFQPRIVPDSPAVEPLQGMAERRLVTILASRVQVEPVVALHGPRSVGKSTLLGTLAAAQHVPVLDLDDPETREVVLANPSLAVGQHTPLCVDEYQHVPLILDAIKVRMNRDGARPGTAVLTGSTRQDALPRTAQALTGRLHTMTIWPLSHGEIDGEVENVLPALRDDPDAAVQTKPTSTTPRESYVDRVFAGGFPLALRRSAEERNRWFDDYVRQTLERDALELKQVRQRQALRELLSRLAGRTGQVLNLNQATQGMTVHRETIDDYTRLLEDLFLLERLPAWGKTLRSRTGAAPKVHVIDSGVAARLMRVSPAELAGLNPTALTEFGSLLETFVVGELQKQISWLDEQITVGHWRTRDGDEVDFVIEFDDGQVLAFEVTANARFRSEDLKGLRKLRDLLGDRFAAGIVLGTGSHSYSYQNKRLHVMPIDRLWTPAF